MNFLKTLQLLLEVIAARDISRSHLGNKHFGYGLIEVFDIYFFTFDSIESRFSWVSILLKDDKSVWQIVEDFTLVFQKTLILELRQEEDLRIFHVYVLESKEEREP